MGGSSSGSGRGREAEAGGSLGVRGQLGLRVSSKTHRTSQKPCLQNKKILGLKRTYCSSRGSEFVSQNPHWESTQFSQVELGLWPCASAPIHSGNCSFLQEGRFGLQTYTFKCPVLPSLKGEFLSVLPAKRKGVQLRTETGEGVLCRQQARQGQNSQQGVV